MANCGRGLVTKTYILQQLKQSQKSGQVRSLILFQTHPVKISRSPKGRGLNRELLVWQHMNRWWYLSGHSTAWSPADQLSRIAIVAADLDPGKS